jgi:hypothetical protein
MYQGLIINLLTRAAWKKSSYQGRDLFPGQFGAVMSHLAESLGVPRTTLQRMVAHLEADGLLTVENVGNRFIVITIVNWHVYQSTEEGEWATNGQPMGDQRATNGQPICESDDKNSKNSDLSSSFEPYNVEEGKKVRKKKVSKARAGASGSVPSFDELVSAYTRNQDLKIALGEFIVMRKASKKAFTNAALTHTFRELDKLAGAEDAAKIAILNQSVQRGWLGVFSLKDNGAGVQRDPSAEIEAQRVARIKADGEEMSRKYEELRRRETTAIREKMKNMVTP